MAIKSAPYYWLECDGCGTRHEPGGGEYSALASAADAIDDAIADDWSTDGERYHCTSCPTLFVCEGCEGPAGEMAGERDYRCPPCFEKAAADSETAEEIHAL